MSTGLWLWKIGRRIERAGQRLRDFGRDLQVSAYDPVQAPAYGGRTTRAPRVFVAPRGIPDIECDCQACNPDDSPVCLSGLGPTVSLSKANRERALEGL